MFKLSLRNVAMGLVISCMLLIASASVEAAPIYAIGGECPTDAQMLANASYTRQYYVTPSLACVFDPASNNITGTQAEADAYLNILGGGWVGLGTAPITGFSYTVDAGNDDGTFHIGFPLTSTYNQFAIGIKDGSNPFWAIFALQAGVTDGLWGFLTEQGDLSHLVLYGHAGDVVINPLCPLPPCDDVPAVPEPASMVLLGTGLLLAARFKKTLIKS